MIEKIGQGIANIRTRSSRGSEKEHSSMRKCTIRTSTLRRKKGKPVFGKAEGKGEGSLLNRSDTGKENTGRGASTLNCAREGDTPRNVYREEELQRQAMNTSRGRIA